MTFRLCITCVLIISLHYIESVCAQETIKGILETHIYPTSVKGPKYKKLKIYLPADYYSQIQRYPVVYLLHGANGNENSWIDQGKILKSIDSLVLCGSIGKYIYVFPNINKYYNDYDSMDSHSINSIDAYLNLNGSIEYSFTYDLVTYIEQTFRTIPTKEYRAIAGLSIGGLHTLYITANAPDIFGFIGLFSPIIYPPPNFGKHSYIYRDLIGKLEHQFSSSEELSLYLIMIGENDPFFKGAKTYSEELKEMKCYHIFEKTSGGHTWDNWSKYCNIFLKSLWTQYP